MEWEEDTMKKLICFVLCVMLAAALALPVFAEEPPSGGGDGDTTTCSHTYDAGTVTVSPTCGQAGTKTCTCTKCGATKTEAISATGNHSWNEGAVTTAPTCGQAGVRTKTCSVCNSTTTESIPATESHSWNEGTVTTAPTCQATGTRTYTCTVCNSTRTENVAIDPNTHSFGAWSAGQSGSHTRTCPCGASESAAHSFSVVSTVPATCKEAGTTSYSCSACGATKSEAIPILTTHTFDNDCDKECNICDYTRETKHKFSESWSKGAQSHWHACIICGEKKDLAPHIPGPAATEEQAQICLACNFILTPKRNHVHDFKDTWTSDDTGHWHACTGCEEQQDFEAHSFDDSCDPDCNICGYLNETAHVQTDVWENDEINHWHVCASCGKSFQLGEHMLEDGEPCSICGFAPVQETHEHTGTGDWLSDEASHWKLCECGEEAEKEAHIWEETKNHKILRCTVCGLERTQSRQTDVLSIVLVSLIVVAGVALVSIVILLIYLGKPPKKPGKYAR